MAIYVYQVSYAQIFSFLIATEVKQPKRYSS